MQPTTLAPTAPTVTATCKCCGSPLRIIKQASLLPARPHFILHDCTNENCLLYAVTLEAAALAALTPQQIMCYGMTYLRRVLTESKVKHGRV